MLDLDKSERKLKEDMEIQLAQVKEDITSDQLDFFNFPKQEITKFQRVLDKKQV